MTDINRAVRGSVWDGGTEQSSLARRAKTACRHSHRSIVGTQINTAAMAECALQKKKHSNLVPFLTQTLTLPPWSYNTADSGADAKTVSEHEKIQGLDCGVMGNHSGADT